VSAPAADETATEPAAEIEERTVMDVVRVAAYSGRKFFGLILGLLGVLLLVFAALDTLGEPPRWKRTPVGAWLRATLFPPMAVVESYPAGARVRVAGIYLDKLTPAVLRRGKVGQNAVVCELDGYKPVSLSIKLAPRRIDAPLDTYRFWFSTPIVISTEPEGATVIWNGSQLKGVTPISDLEGKVGGRPCALELSRPGFQPIRQTLNLGDPAGVGGQFYEAVRETGPGGLYYWRVRAKFYGYAHVSVTPADADVMLVTGSGARLVLGRGTEMVQYGRHTLEASKGGYVTANRQLSITRGDTVSLSIALRVLVQITVIDTATRHDVTSQRFELEPGVRTITVSAPGYIPRTMTINVPAGGPVIRTVALVHGSAGKDSMPAPGARATVVVRDEEDAPVPGVTVYAISAKGGTRTQLGLTDSQGRVFADAREGEFAFEMVKGTEEPRRSPVARALKGGAGNEVILYYRQ